MERREKEHQQCWPKSHIYKVGKKKTEKGAFEWEKKQPKAVTPESKKK